ncbi:MAG: alkaline phosphatase [Deltaproteobacteria bacterium]|nr:alkaline phosphatase [Deltaproteobacteria bacterium]
MRISFRFPVSGLATRLATGACLVLLLAQAAWAAEAKYVFLFIGDGMSVSQSSAAEMYKAALKGEAKAGVEKLNFSTFPAQGMTTTYSSESLITDSAAAGTAIASGVKTYNAGLGVDVNGKPVRTFAELARDAGKKVGIVSSVSLDHATPAAFYAHQKSRKNYYEIGLELAASDFDYFAGGGLLDPAGKKSKAEGEKVNVIDAIKKAGYAYINDKTGFEALKAGAKAVVVNPRLQDEQAMPYAMDTTAEDIGLADLTAKGIEVLDNPKGFFMMVEAGKIDWACHANDAMAAIGDVLAFEQAVAKAVDFAAKHPKDTLIVVTGDHETGGLTLGFSGTKYSTYFKNLQHQKVSYVAFNEEFDAWRKANPTASFDAIATLVETRFGLKTPSETELADMAKAAADAEYAKSIGSKYAMYLKDFELADLKAAFARSMAGEKIKAAGRDYLLYGSYEPFTVTLTHLLNQKAGLAWTSYSHTGVPVLTSATGAGAESFSGFYDNTDMFTKFVDALGLKASVAMN